MSTLDAEEMTLDFDGWLGKQPPERRAGIDAHLKASGPMADTEKKRLASMFAISEDTGVDLATVNERWSTVRGGYAEQRGGDWLAVKDDEAGFHGRLVKDMTRRKDLRIQTESFADTGAADALKIEPEDFMSGATRAWESAKSIAGAEPGDADLYLKSYQTNRAAMDAVVRPLRPVARRVFDKLSQGKGNFERFTPENQAVIEGAIDELAAIPPKERGVVVAMLSKEGGGDSTDGTGEKTGKAAVRGLVGQLRGFMQNFDRSTMMAYQKNLERETPPRVLLNKDGTADLETTRLVGMGLVEATTQAFRGERRATAEEHQAMKDTVARDLERSDVAGEAISILEGVVDPIKTSGVFQRVAVDTGGSLGAMAPIMVPYLGALVAQGGYADQEYQRQRAMGTSRESAQAAAQLTGAVQAGIERVGFLFNFAPSSAVGNLAPKFTTPGLATSFAAQAAGRMGTIQAVEYGEEIAQAAVPIMTAKIGEKLGWDLPEQARFAGEIQNFKEEGGFWRPDVFMTVAALSVFGGGYQGVKNTVEARATLAAQLDDPINAVALGIKPDAAAAIAALAPQDRLEAYKAAYSARDVTTPAAVAAQAAVTSRVDAQIREANQVAAKMDAAGISIGRSEDETGAPVWTVTDAGGQTVTHANLPEAMATARAAMDEGDIRKDDSFFSALENFTERMNPDDLIKVTRESPTLLSEAEGAQTRLEEADSDVARNKASADLSAIWERANVNRRAAGQADLNPDMTSEADRQGLESLRVFGKSETEFRDGIARSVLTIYEGGNAADLLEENAEAVGKTFAAEGGLPALAGALRSIEAATGDRYLFGEDTNATAVAEGFSDLVRVYATATRGSKASKAVRGEKAAEVRQMRDRLRQEQAAGNAATAGIFEKLAAYFEAFKATMSRAARLMKAKKEGKITAEIEDLINKSVGLSAIRQHEAAVRADVQKSEGSTFSVRPADSLEAISSALNSLARDPAERLAGYEAAAESLAGMSRAMAFNDDAVKSSSRKDQLRYLQTLDAILVKFPPEVRGKVGGFVKLASLTTNAARQREIIRRIGKLDIEVERFLQKEYSARMKELLERSKPVKGAPGEKMVGKLGPDVQRLMDAVAAAMKMSAVDTDAEVAAIEKRIDSGELTPEQELLAMRERELVTLAGDWRHADASRMAAALKAAQDTFTGGFMEWQRKQLEKRERRAVMREELVAATGTQGTDTERDARAEQDLGWRGKAKDFFLSLGSFEEVTSYIFGKDSPESRRLTDAERTASYQYEDAIDDMSGRVQDFFTQVAGSRLAGEKLRFKLSQKSIKAGTRTLAEMETIQALLMWAQPDGKRHMEGARDENNQPSSKWHYTQEWIDDAFSKLSPEGRAAMDFIRGVYAAEWATLNPLYRERHGVDLPRNENYAPITVAPQQAKAGEMVDPVSGAVVTGSILTPGSLRTRSRTAVAEPEFRDALQVMLAHHKQMEHWKAYYDFAVEAQAVIGHRDVANAVKAVGGGQGKVVLSKWLDLFAQGGNRDAAAALATNGFLAKIYGRAARMALVGRAGTLMIQATQLGAAAAEMPAGAFVSRFGKLMSGNLGWKDAIRSEFIQRRISEAPPIVRQAMAGLDSDNPNAVKHATARLGTLISGADGLFTAGTYAIVLDYQRGMAKQAGLTGAEAEAYAHAEAARITERVAQPTRAGTRSLFENASTGPLAKLGWAFASEARQKLSLAVWAARAAKDDPARAARVAFVVWGVGGLMAAAIRNAWRDLRDDDDEEIFDERNWSLPSLVASTIAGPLQGIPGLGEALQGAVSKMAGTYAPGGNLFDSLGRSVPAVKDLATLDFLDDKEPVEEIMKDVEAVMTAGGLFNETAASATSLFHIVRDGVSLLDASD